MIGYFKVKPRSFSRPVLLALVNINKENEENPSYSTTVKSGFGRGLRPRAFVNVFGSIYQSGHERPITGYGDFGVQDTFLVYAWVVELVQFYKYHARNQKHMNACKRFNTKISKQLKRARARKLLPLRLSDTNNIHEYINSIHW